jgi:flap endonuclease-1
MGIKGLTQVLADNAPGSIKEKEFSQLCGRKVAVDASMFLYSFLIAIRPDSHYTLTDAEGNTTRFVCLAGGHCVCRSLFFLCCC